MGKLSTKLILIVDDEDDLREILVDEFSALALKVFEASNGRDAFEIVKNQPIEIVLSDIRMTNGDGIELLKNIKNFNPLIPIVFLMTGFSDQIDVAKENGVTRIFSKPFCIEKIIQEIEDNL